MNIRLLRTATLAAIALFIADGLYAQARRSATVPPRIEELPCFPIDTIATPDPDTRIILYSNNTWNYYRPGMSRLDKLDVYNKNWETEQIFAYHSIELADLPSVVDLKLISSLNDFCVPKKGKVFSKYGPRGRRNHNGVDIPLKTGDPVCAIFDGKVRYSKYNTGGFGNLIIIRHRNGLETWYAHLSKSNIEPGDYVKAGDIIGYGGSTGRSRGPHLHFEMRYCDQTFDPEHLIDFETGQLRYQTFALEKSFFNIHSRATDKLEEDEGFDLLAMVSDAEGLTSEQIINGLEKAQTKQPAKLTASGSNTVYHTVKSGDILGKLAMKYGVSIDQICRLNSISRNTTLRIGKKLRVK